MGGPAGICHDYLPPNWVADSATLFSFPRERSLAAAPENGF